MYLILMRLKALWTLFWTICLLLNIFLTFYVEVSLWWRIQVIILTRLKYLFFMVASHTNQPKKFELGQVSFWPVMSKILKIKQKWFKPGSLNIGNSLKICPVEKGILGTLNKYIQIHWQCMCPVEITGKPNVRPLVWVECCQLTLILNPD